MVQLLCELGLFVGPGLGVRGRGLPAEAAVGPEIVVVEPSRSESLDPRLASYRIG
jgi:hypothetical protein